MHSNVFPFNVGGSGGSVAGYLIFRNLCSPWGIGISKQYFLVTNLHLNLVIFLNYVALSVLNSTIMFDFYWVSSSDSDDGYVVIQEDGGNDFGERTFVSKVLKDGTPMTFYFLAQSGGRSVDPLCSPRSLMRHLSFEGHAVPRPRGG